VITNRIIVLRAERRWSQETLAKKVGVTRQTISSIENGRYGLSLELAFKIANAFDVTITDVFQEIKS
jgi:putative transcriptional regulator